MKKLYEDITLIQFNAMTNLSVVDVVFAGIVVHVPRQSLQEKKKEKHMADDKRTPAPEYEIKTLLKYETKDEYTGWLMQIKEKK